MDINTLKNIYIFRSNTSFLLKNKIGLSEMTTLVLNSKACGVQESSPVGGVGGKAPPTIKNSAKSWLKASDRKKMYFKSVQIYMKDAERSETNKKSNLDYEESRRFVAEFYLWNNFNLFMW